MYAFNGRTKKNGSHDTPCITRQQRSDCLTPLQCMTTQALTQFTHTPHQDDQVKRTRHIHKLRHEHQILNQDFLASSSHESELNFHLPCGARPHRLGRRYPNQHAVPHLTYYQNHHQTKNPEAQNHSINSKLGFIAPSLGAMKPRLGAMKPSLDFMVFSQPETT